MQLIPAIDLKAGACVRLHQGDFDQVTQYDVAPLQVAQQYQAAGATALHVVDLDGARCGQPVHLEVLQTLCRETTLAIQTGGGIRSATQIEALFEQGVQRVVVGSLLVKEPALGREWLQHFGGDRMVLALDVQMEAGEPWLYTHGWQQKSNTTLWSLLDDWAELSPTHVLCTDIDRDGTLAGPNLEFYRECLKRYPHIQFQASGGIGQLADLSELQAIHMPAAIIGKALYEGKFTLTQALQRVAVSC